MRRSNADVFSLAPFTMAALTINIILFIISAMQSKNIIGMDSNVLAALGGSQRERLWQGEWLRLIAPMFLHGGLLHILMNMNYLWRAGSDAEIYFGTSNYGTIYLLSGISGFCLSQIFGGHLAIGASGSLCGIMGAHLAVLILKSPRPMQAWRNSAVKAEAFNLLFLLGIGLTGFMRMDNWGHFGGMVAGLFLGASFELWSQRSRFGQLGVFATLIVCAVLIAAARWTVFNPTYHIFMSAVAKDEDRNPVAQKYHAEEARKWSRSWSSASFLGVLNESQTESILRNHTLGNWTSDDAVNPRIQMATIIRACDDGDLPASLRKLMRLDPSLPVDDDN
ncbi:MAG: rhomboid family intramembrane serine protease [Planctomycetota bacterium]